MTTILVLAAKDNTDALKLINTESGTATVIRKRFFFFFKQVWVVLSDAEEASRTGTDTKSSWFLKRCRIGAGPPVITKF